MSSAAITGSCLCGSVKFEVTPPFAAFRYCHCSRCQKATGSAHASNAFIPVTQFKWLAGEALIKHFDLPGAKRFAVVVLHAMRDARAAQDQNHGEHAHTGGLAGCGPRRAPRQQHLLEIEGRVVRVAARTEEV